MIPVDFDGTNIELTKPDDMTDEQCMSCRAYRGIDEDGFHFYLMAFNPSLEDLNALNEGRPLMVKVIGKSFAPICLYTFDENFNPNI